MKTLFIDLETLSCTDPARIEYVTAHMKPPANYKSETAINKWLVENRQKTIDNTVFDGSSGTICTIGYSVNGEPPCALQVDEVVTEKIVIQEFFDNLAITAKASHIKSSLLQIKWIAHNAAFDLPFLFKRCVILGIDTHEIRIPHNDRHGSKHLFCTMVEWMGFGSKAGGSLDNICNALGMTGKDGFDGSMVGDAFNNGEYKKIAEYCQDDVRKLIEIYNRLTFQQ